MRKLISTILVLCMVLCLLPVTAAADDADPAEPTVPTETVKLDVGGEDADNSEYYVGEDIRLRKDGVVYELTGTTDKKLQMWGSNSPDPVKTFYLRLNGATINGGITITKIVPVPSWSSRWWTARPIPFKRSMPWISPSPARAR